MLKTYISLALSSTLLVCSSAFAQRVEIVKDLNATKAVLFPDSPMVPIGNRFLFEGYFENDSNPWITDGTQSGTFQLTETLSGSRNSNMNFLANLGTAILFSAESEGRDGYNIWISNGSPEGTRKVVTSDGTIFRSQQIENYLSFNGRFFLATQAGLISIGDNGIIANVTSEYLQPIASCDSFALFSGYSNGTALKVLRQNSSMIESVAELPGVSMSDRVFGIGLGNKVIFRAYNSSLNLEPYVSDGTAQGTGLLKDVSPGPGGSYPHSFFKHQGLIHFIASIAGVSQKWVSDGTQVGTLPLASYNSALATADFVIADSVAYAVAPGSIQRYTSILAPPQTLTIPSELQNGGRIEFAKGSSGILFLMTSRPEGTGRRISLYRADSSALAFTLIESHTLSSSFGIVYAASNGGRLLYQNPVDFETKEIGFVDQNGTARSLRIEFERTMSTSFGDLVSVGDVAVFTANQGTKLGIWSSDGTSSGTRLVKDLGASTDSGFYAVREINGLSSLWAGLRYSGEEASGLWISDGTSNGTRRVEIPGFDIDDDTVIAGLDRSILLQPNNQSTTPTLIYNVDSGGRLTVPEFSGNGARFRAEACRGIGGRFYCVASDRLGSNDVLVSIDSQNGSAAIITTLPLQVTSKLYLDSLVTFKSRIWFLNFRSNEIYLTSTDGTQAGTRDEVPLVATLGSNYSQASSWITNPDEPREVVASDSSLFFISPDNNRRLIRSDGTSAGTYLLAPNCNGCQDSSVRSLRVINNLLFYAADSDDGLGYGAAVSDGTLLNTRFVGPVSGRVLPYDAQDFTVLDSSIYLRAATPNSGAEIFRFGLDGTGISLVKNINPGGIDSDPIQLTKIRRGILFIADSKDFGSELHIIADDCPQDLAKLEGGICGCGIAESDVDQDGAIDCQESCPNDPAKTSGQICGCGNSDSDQNRNEVVDCLEAIIAKRAATPKVKVRRNRVTISFLIPDLLRGELLVRKVGGRKFKRYVVTGSSITKRMKPGRYQVSLRHLAPAPAKKVGPNSRYTRFTVRAM